MINDERQSAAVRKNWTERRRSLEPRAVSFSSPAAHADDSPLDAQTLSVKKLYENFPYPSPIIGDGFISDLSIMIGLLLPRNDLAGWNILDAGCGTGHRILAVAKDYPGACFTGVDMTEASLAVARKLAEKHGIGNVHFERANLLEFESAEQYDLIVSTGVIHHLSDPRRGLINLCKRLSSKGIILVWLYHALGEFDRLLSRELTLLLWGPDREAIDEGVGLMNDLSLDLSTVRYGTETSAPRADSLSRPSINADAYLHPIVNAYRFEEVFKMFEGSGLEWVAPNAINIDGDGKLIALDPADDTAHRHITGEDLFRTRRLLASYRRLSKRDKLKAIELMLKPTGLSVLAGRSDSYLRCEGRIGHNRLDL